MVLTFPRLSGSVLIRLSWIRIRIQNTEPNQGESEWRLEGKDLEISGLKEL